MKRFVVSLLVIKAFLLTCPAANPFCNAADMQKPFHKWAATPPMGWNSWDCYGPTVVESGGEIKCGLYGKEPQKIRAGSISLLISDGTSRMIKSGGYNEENPIYTIDNYGRFTPALNRFPSAANGNGFKPLADYIHGKGLKFGIDMMRGIPVIAVRNNTPILGSTSKAGDIYSPEGQCGWLKDMYTVVAGKPGAQEYYNSLFQLYASWEIDFVKVDDLSGRTKEIEMIRKAIDNCGKPIVLSISPGGDEPEQPNF